MLAERHPELIVAEPTGRYALRTPLVLDCSILASALFAEANRDVASETIAGHDLYAPALLDFEIASVALKKWRLGLHDIVEQAMTEFDKLFIERCYVDPRQQLRVALDYNLSGYDAAYLCVAMELRAPLATFDARLGTVAKAVLSGS